MSRNIDPGFWGGRRVFITGHTGFKGSWLCLLLEKLGAVVSGYSLEPPTNPNLFELSGLGASISSSTLGDVRDCTALSNALRHSRSSIAIHLAAQPMVLSSYQNPIETFNVNVIGTACFLEAVRHAPDVRAALVITSDKCYENREWPWPYRETDELGGYDPYSNSKGCAELVTRSFRQSFFNPDDYHKHRVAVATARAGNVIGGGDWGAYRIVPDCMRTFLKGEPVVLRNPNAIRPWQHVLEPLSGYLMLCERLVDDGAAMNGGWNFGPDQALVKTVRELAEAITTHLPSSPGILVPEARTQPHEAHTLCLDCSKAKAQLGWLPRLSFEETVRLTVQWYRRVADGENARSVSREQLTDFLGR